MSSALYTYRAMIHDVYDGDSCTAFVDLGFGTAKPKVKFRLAFIDTPELRGKGVSTEEKEMARIIRDYVRELVLDKWVEVKSREKGKYGRWIASIWFWDEQDRMLNLSDHLVHKGFAVYKDY